MNYNLKGDPNYWVAFLIYIKKNLIKKQKSK